MNNEFYKYATKHCGINSLALEKYTSTVTNYISPTIIEERQLNVAQMDVFSRLMMDRIIFLGDEINDYVDHQIMKRYALPREKIFAIHITDKGVLSTMNWQISMKKVNNPAQRIGRRLEQVLF